MRGYFHLLIWLCGGWLLVLVELYRTLGATAQDRASVEFLLALGALIIGGLALVIAWGVEAVRGHYLSDPSEPEDLPGPPRWDEEYDTGSTGDELEDLGLVKPQPPLPSDRGEKRP